MNIILLEDKDNLGEEGDVVEVKDGYARNYLIPQGFAMEATESNKKKFEEIQRQKNIREERKKEESKQLAEEIESLSITIPVKVGEQDQVYGSVTKNDIAEHIQEKGFDIDSKNIQLEDSIKSLGIYEVPVNLPAGVTSEVKVWVIKE